MFWEEMSFEEFKDGGHLGYRNGTILAILNPHITKMSTTKFQLNPTYGSGGDVENVTANDGRTDDGQQAMASADLDQSYRITYYGRETARNTSCSEDSVLLTH